MLLLALLAHASDAEPVAPSWTVSVDPLTLALGFAHVQVERVLAPGCSLYAGPSLRLYDSLLGEPSGPFRGLGGEVGVRGFFTGAAPEGGWLMARGVLAQLSRTDGRDDTAVGGYASALVGYTWIGPTGLVLSGGAGASWFAYEVGGVGIAGPLPALHTAAGWAL